MGNPENAPFLMENVAGLVSSVRRLQNLLDRALDVGSLQELRIR